jgi:hypothetical protein
LTAAPKGRAVPVGCVVRATGQPAPTAAAAAPGAAAAAGPFYFTFMPAPGTSSPPPPAAGSPAAAAMQPVEFPPGVDVTALVFSVLAVPTPPGGRAHVDFHIDDFAYDVVTEF